MERAVAKTKKDRKRTPAYDSKIIKWFLRYVRPYRTLLFISIVLLLFITVFDLALPYITKVAIDKYVMPSYAEIILNGRDPDFERSIRQKYADILVPLGENRFICDLSRLPKEDRVLLETKQYIGKERYIVVTPDMGTEAVEKAENYPEVFRKVNGMYIAPVEATKKLKPKDLMVIRGRDLAGVKKMALLFFLILFLSFIFNFVQVYTLQYIGQKVMYDMRMELLKHMIRLPIDFFNRNPVGRLVTRATNDISAINEMFTSVFVYLFKDIFLIIGILVIMAKMNLKLTILIFLLVPIIAIIALEFRRRAREAYREVRAKLAKMNSFLQESISGIRVIQHFVQENRMFDKFAGVNHEYYLANIRQILVYAVFRPLIEIIGALAVALIVWYGGLEVLKQALSFGALVAFLSYVEMLFEPVKDLSEKYNIMQSAIAAGERIMGVLEEKPERRKGRVLDKVRGEIEFRNVWFAYEKDNWVLKDVSFKVEAGQTVALVGPTGAGKTSIINLLLRFHEPQKGQILLDGVDIRELDLEFLRKQMAVVLQDVFIFSGDIKGNIRLWEDSITDEEIKKVAEYVHAHDFIKDLEGQYDSKLGERGVTLSFGQRQLLAFARALAFNPKILILDEATSNIDTHTEMLVQKGIQKMLEGRTSIVIAHRLSTIRNADKIVVIYGGKVLEEGTHEELLRKKGLYYHLYMIQFSGKETETRSTEKKV